MLGRLFAIGLVVASLAMLLFVTGFVLHKLGLAPLTGLFYVLAEKTLLVAFGLLFLACISGLVRAIWRDLASYFNREAAAWRRVLSLQLRRNEFEQFQALKSRQLAYRALFQRQRLSAADNRKQAAALFHTVSQELQSAKAHLPNNTYREVSRRLRIYKKRDDAAAMLALREKFRCP